MPVLYAAAVVASDVVQLVPLEQVPGSVVLNAFTPLNSTKATVNSVAGDEEIVTVTVSLTDDLATA